MRARPGGRVLLRVADPEWSQLVKLLTSRFPSWEWASFVRLGWREAPAGLVLTLAGIDEPGPGDLDDRVGHVAMQEPYTLRMALAAEKHGLAVGIVHSHPLGCVPRPSTIDDDMDGYYADYFEGFAPGRPYVSLIYSEVTGRPVLSGRVWWRHEWWEVEHMSAPRSVALWGPRGPVAPPSPRARTARLNSAMGDEAAARLRGARVGVIGAGGTGSPAVEVLVRAGVGALVIVDPDHIEESNLERVHGSLPRHVEGRTAKVAVAREHAQSIDPACEVEAIIGRLPQPEVIDAIVRCDVVLGCTDQQHSRLALSEIAFRYLVPALDCGVTLEGGNGLLTGQIAQFVRFLPSDPCVICRKMLAPTRLAQELMDPGERERRQRAAADAVARGEAGDPYWRAEPQLNTVGYLTTAVGALAAGYVIGWITGRFAPPFSRLQANLGAPYWDVTDQPEAADPACTCRAVRGWADQGAAHALISAPGHWPWPVKL